MRTNHHLVWSALSDDVSCHACFVSYPFCCDDHFCGSFCSISSVGHLGAAPYLSFGSCSCDGVSSFHAFDRGSGLNMTMSKMNTMILTTLKISSAFFVCGLFCPYLWTGFWTWTSNKIGTSIAACASYHAQYSWACLHPAFLRCRDCPSSVLPWSTPLTRVGMKAIGSARANECL